MEWLNSIKRFAGDRLEDLKAGYNAADNQFGGILPGGTEFDPAGLARTVAKDALPGTNTSSFSRGVGSKGAKSGLVNDAYQGNVSRVAARANATKAASGLREGFIEEVGERGGKALAERAIKNQATRRALGAVVPPITLYDGINDAKNAYSGLLEVTTGRNLEQNMALAADKRDPLYGIPEPGTPVMPADGSIPTIEQGNSNSIPAMQELSSRVALATGNFNPLKGEFGVSELFYGK